MAGREEKSGEADARRAIEYWVEAFLLDRKGQSDLFSRAHEVGGWLAEGVGCPYTFNPRDQSYSRDCGIYALHQPWALSPAWVVNTRCSICDAGPFACDHVPGETYGEVECASVVTDFIGFDHVALTPNPDFVSNFRQTQSVSADQAKAAGVEPGQPLYCKHCTDCPGRFGPSEGDLDPVGRFEGMAARHQRDAD